MHIALKIRRNNSFFSDRRYYILKIDFDFKNKFLIIKAKYKIVASLH